MDYIIKNANLLDGTLDSNQNMNFVSNATVIIQDKKIKQILPDEKDAELPKNFKIIDLQGAYMIPGLINMHVHLASSGKPPKANAKPKNYKALFDKLSKYKTVLHVLYKMECSLAKQYLYSGTTTIRTVGGILDIDRKVRDAVNAGKTKGPRILSCNTAVSVPGGHFAGSLATETTSPQTAVQDVAKITATNPDWIKLMITGGVMDASAEGEPGVLRMPAPTVKAACDEAHKRGFKVAAHVESPEGVRVALENGVDTIEHGANPDSTILELFKKNQAADICTISPALPYVELPESISHCGDLGRKNGKIVMEGIIQCARECLQEGIPVGLGTDGGCNFIRAYDTWRELKYFVKYVGVTPDFALHTATQVNAQILGIQDQTGTLEPGKYADFMVCSSNPLKDLGTLANPIMVSLKGKIINKPRIKKNRYIEKVLDTL